MNIIRKVYNHYFKRVPSKYIDIYRVLLVFEVDDPCISHAVKKLLVAGKRGAKGIDKDIGEAIDSLRRWQEMREEERQDKEESVSSDNP